MNSVCKHCQPESFEIKYCVFQIYIQVVIGATCGDGVGKTMTY